MCSAHAACGRQDAGQPAANGEENSVPSMPAWPLSMPHRVISVAITKVNTIVRASMAHPPNAAMKVRRSVLFLYTLHGLSLEWF